jgi:hypothetical protein
MLALTAFAASAGGELALATPARGARGEGSARDAPHGEPREPQASERDSNYGLHLVCWASLSLPATSFQLTTFQIASK